MNKISNIFVSYRSSDIKEAEKLASELKADGHNVWLDVWNIDPGDSITQRMNEGLASSNVFILCLSSQNSLAPWMSREWYSALARKLNGENVRIIPLILPGGSLPAIIADIRCVDGATDYSAALKELRRTLLQVDR